MAKRTLLHSRYSRSSGSPARAPLQVSFARAPQISVIVQSRIFFSRLRRAWPTVESNHLITPRSQEKFWLCGEMALHYQAIWGIMKGYFKDLVKPSSTIGCRIGFVWCSSRGMNDWLLFPQVIATTYSKKPVRNSSLGCGGIFSSHFRVASCQQFSNPSWGFGVDMLTVLSFQVV